MGIMKKISTVLILFAVAMSVLALPQNKILKLEPVAQTSVKTKVVEMIKHDVTKRVARPEQTNVDDNHFAAQAKHAIRPVQNAVKETITLDGGVFLVEPEYEAETREWYIAVESHGYTFRLCWYGPADDFTGTFSFDDISWDWTWGWYQSQICSMRFSLLISI